MKNYQKAIALLTVAGVLLGTASPLAGHAAAAATKASTSTQASLKGVQLCQHRRKRLSGPDHAGSEMVRSEGRIQAAD